MIRVTLHPLLLLLLSVLGTVGPAGLHGWMHVEGDHGHGHGHEAPAETCGADGHADDRLESRHGHELVGHDAHCAICLLVRQAPSEVRAPQGVPAADEVHARAPDLVDAAIRPARIASPVGARAPPVCG